MPAIRKINLTEHSQHANARSSLDQALSGDAVVLHQALPNGQTALENLRAGVHAGIASTCGPDVAEQVERHGIESLHRWIDGAQMTAANVAATDACRHVAVRACAELLHDRLGEQAPLHISSQVMLRFFPPYAYYRQHQANLRQRPGHTRYQGPHQDDWFDQARETLNLWIAIGRVDAANGVCLFPDHWGRSLANDGHGRLGCAIAPGEPWTFPLVPGDTVLFHGQHLHSSVLNRTDDTRVVVTVRVTRTTPTFSTFEQWHPWYDSLRVHQDPDYLAQQVQQPIGAWMRQRLHRGWRQLSQKLKTSTKSGPSAPVLATQDTSGLDPAIRIIDHTTIAVRDGNDERLLARRCPHEGADLALGRVCAGRLQCPWHLASFDLNSGASDCPGVSGLGIRSVPL